MATDAIGYVSVAKQKWSTKSQDYTFLSTFVICHGRTGYGTIMFTQELMNDCMNFIQLS